MIAEYPESDFQWMVARDGHGGYEGESIAAVLKDLRVIVFSEDEELPVESLMDDGTYLLRKDKHERSKIEIIILHLLGERGSQEMSDFIREDLERLKQKFPELAEFDLKLRGDLLDVVPKKEFFKKLGKPETAIKGIFRTDFESIQKLGESSADKVMSSYEGNADFPELIEVAESMAEKLEKEPHMATGLAVQAFVKRLTEKGEPGLTFRCTNGDKEFVMVSKSILKLFVNKFSHHHKDFTMDVKRELVDSATQMFPPGMASIFDEMEREWLLANSEAEILSKESPELRISKARRKI